LEGRRVVMPDRRMGQGKRQQGVIFEGVADAFLQLICIRHNPVSVVSANGALRDRLGLA
jgi:hypothetical protein